MPRQRFTQQEIDELSARFQRRYETQFAWKSACSVILGLPALIGFWPTSAIGLGGSRDIAGGGLHLTYNGNGTYNRAGLAPYFDADGAGDYLDRADEALLDITGLETYIDAAVRGLTIGGWFWVDTLNDFDAFIGKYAAGQFSYWLRQSTAANARVDFLVSNNGVAAVLASSTVGSLSTGEWRFLVGRFDPSTRIALFDTGNWYTNIVAIPASLHIGTADLVVCAGTAGINTMDGRASLNFLCAAQLDNSLIVSIFEQTKAMYGVK